MNFLSSARFRRAITALTFILSSCFATYTAFQIIATGNNSPNVFIFVLINSMFAIILCQANFQTYFYESPLFYNCLPLRRICF